MMPPLLSSIKFNSSLNPAKNEPSLKREYLSHLLPAHLGQSELNVDYLFTTPLEKLQYLYLCLKNVFTDSCTNTERSTIIYYLLDVNINEWEILLKQVCFIMPIGTPGHDVMCATEILSKVSSSAYREKLTHVANRLFKYDTLTIERGIILNVLAKLDFETLSKLDNADEQTRDQFFAEHVSPFFKERETYAYDPIQSIGYKCLI